MDKLDKTKTVTPHQLILQDRNLVEMTGVSDVDSFDENVVIAYTDLGALTLRGDNLHVQRLDLDTGSLSVTGRVDALQYTQVTKGGFLSRLLR